jgi:hypothetical protein
MVVLMGHRTQRRMNAQAKLKTITTPASPPKRRMVHDGVSANKNRVRTLSTASGAGVRWPAFFLLFDPLQIIHQRLQRLGNHYRAISLLIVFEQRHPQPSDCHARTV